MPLMLGAANPAGISAGVGFVHDDEFRAGAKKVIPAMVRLDVVQGNDREGVVLKEALASSALGFQTTSCSCQNQFGLDLELAPSTLAATVQQGEAGRAQPCA